MISFLSRSFTGAVLGALACAALAEPLPADVAVRTLDIRGTPIEVHTYKPAHYSGGALLVTLHGRNRNAAGYLAYSKPLAERHGFLLVAPLFERTRFPTWRYQSGGIARYSGAPDTEGFELEAQSLWTATMLLEIVERIREEEGASALPYYLLGHSAGAQLLSRFAAFVPNAAERIVIANPSTYIWPTREARFPFGFGGMPAPLGDDEAIRRYLAQPVTLFLGSADVKHDASLNVTEGAMRQGAHRYGRGLNVFHAARALARDRGWPFNWRLVEAQGVGHSARAMYDSAAADVALIGR